MRASQNLNNEIQQPDRSFGSASYELGQEILLRQDGVCLLPLCPINGYFNRRRVRELIHWALSNFEKTHIFIPDLPTEHTLLAMGYDQNCSRRKARLQGSRLRNMALEAIAGHAKEKSVDISRWDAIEKNDAYQRSLVELRQLYDSKTDFRAVVDFESASVIGRSDQVGKSELPSALREAKEYVLEELAYLSSVREIHGLERAVYLYHKHWFLSDFLDGKFGCSQSHLGICLVSFD